MNESWAGCKRERWRNQGGRRGREKGERVQRWKDIRSAEERKWVLGRKAKADREVEERVKEDDDRKEIAAGKWKRTFLN